MDDTTVIAYLFSFLFFVLFFVFVAHPTKNAVARRREAARDRFWAVCHQQTRQLEHRRVLELNGRRDHLEGGQFGHVEATIFVPLLSLVASVVAVVQAVWMMYLLVNVDSAWVTWEPLEGGGYPFRVTWHPFRRRRVDVRTGRSECLGSGCLDWVLDPEGSVDEQKWLLIAVTVAMAGLAAGVVACFDAPFRERRQLVLWTAFNLLVSVPYGLAWLIAVGRRIDAIRQQPLSPEHAGPCTHDASPRCFPWWEQQRSTGLVLLGLANTLASFFLLWFIAEGGAQSQAGGRSRRELKWRDSRWRRLLLFLWYDVVCCSGRRASRQEGDPRRRTIRLLEQRAMHEQAARQEGEVDDSVGPGQPGAEPMQEGRPSQVEEYSYSRFHQQQAAVAADDELRRRQQLDDEAYARRLQAELDQEARREMMAEEAQARRRAGANAAAGGGAGAAGPAGRGRRRPVALEGLEGYPAAADDLGDGDADEAPGAAVPRLRPDDEAGYRVSDGDDDDDDDGGGGGGGGGGNGIDVDVEPGGRAEGDLGRAGASVPVPVQQQVPDEAGYRYSSSDAEPSASDEDDAAGGGKSVIFDV